jgi:molecular chaperone GrpE (heat shock protein)
MSDALLAKLDEVLTEIRRQGRASVGAQASAEACLKEVKALHSAQLSLANEEGSTTARAPFAQSPPNALSEDGLRTLLPLLDAIDAAVRQTRAAEQPQQPSAGLGARLRSGLSLLRPNATPNPYASLRRGLEMIQLEARSALKRLGVEIDERTEIAVDPERHRVVDVDSGSGSGSGGVRRVIEVLRPGYVLGGARVREADIVARR